MKKETLEKAVCTVNSDLGSVALSSNVAIGISGSGRAGFVPFVSIPIKMNGKVMTNRIYFAGSKIDGKGTVEDYNKALTYVKHALNIKIEG